MEVDHFEWILETFERTTESVCLTEIWSGIQQIVVDEACVRAKGRHFKKFIIMSDVRVLSLLFYLEQVNISWL